MTNLLNYFKKNHTLISLFLSIIIFLSFGFYHLTKFETSDEHLWKNLRIPQYWQGVSNGFKTGDWKTTYINDKPGVSLALISGMGLPFINNPLDQRLTEEEAKNGGLFKVWDVAQTESINFALRLPLLLFNGLLMIPLLVYLVYKSFKDKRIASFFALFLGLNPIIVGVGQIMNPDTLLWSLTAGSFFSFIALLKTKQRKFIWIAGVLTGFSLLSKYTANLLFLFYGLIAFLYWIYNKKVSKQYWKYFLKNYFYIILISWIIFAIFLPAVIQSPDLLSWKKPKHFAYGTYFSPALKPIIIPLIISFLFLIFDSYLLNNRLMFFIRRQLRRYRFWLIKIVSFSLLILFLFAIINAFTHISQIIPLDDLKEKIGSTKKLHFYFTDHDPLIIAYAKQLATESFNFIFSLPALNIILLLFFWLFAFLKPKRIGYSAEIIFISLVPFIFFAGGLLAKVFVNVRYSIMIYPLFALLCSLALITIIDQLFIKKNIIKKKMLPWITFIVIIIITIYHLTILSSVKPFFFNFQNKFLPKEYALSDSWSYGIYEAAKKLNSLPQAQNLKVWSDRGAFCRYFIGHCIGSRRIDRDKIIPDFIIVTRRNVARGRFFKWLKGTENLAKHQPAYYYQGDVFNNPWWELQINNRPKSYIKIIKLDEKNN